MTAMLLFLGGCQREEEMKFEELKTNDIFFKKNNINEIKIKDLKAEIIDYRSNSEDSINLIINTAHAYFINKNLLDIKQKIEANLGIPLWDLTLFYSKNGEFISQTPIYSQKFGIFTNLLIYDSKHKKILLMDPKTTFYEQYRNMRKLFEKQINGGGVKVNSLSIGGTGGGGGTNPNVGETYEWDCSDINIYISEVWESTMDGATTNQPDTWDIYSGGDGLVGQHFDHIEGGYVITTFSIDYERDCKKIISTDNWGSDPYQSGSGGGGSSGSGFAWETRTWEKCKKYFNKSYDSQSDKIRDFIFQNCGDCRQAVNISDYVIEIWKNSPQAFSKSQCAICTSLKFGADLSVLESLEHMKFPCQNVDKEKLIDEILPDCNWGQPYNFNWTDFAEKMKEKSWITLDMNNFSYKMSKDVSNTGKFLGINPAILHRMPPEDLCNKVKIYECLSSSPGIMTTFGEDDKKEVFDFYQNSTVVNPCTGENINLDNIIVKLCNEGSLSMSGLDESLSNSDHIIIDKSFKNCAPLKCIYNKLLNSGSKMFCNNIYKFNYTSAIDLKISVGTPASNAEAHVTMGKNGDGVEMVFNKWNCDETDHLRLAETMLHESVHAKFRYDHARNGTTEAEYRKNFLKYVNEKYGIPYDDHTLMIKKYMNKLATELWELNGEKYDPSYYMAWVAEGLEQYWPEKFSEADKKSWKDKRDIVNANNPFKCKK